MQQEPAELGELIGAQIQLCGRYGMAARAGVPLRIEKAERLKQARHQEIAHVFPETFSTTRPSI